MQFHLDGFHPGDPDVHPAGTPHPSEMPPQVDVLIIGCGPTGLTLAAQLAAFPEITVRIVERKPGPLEVGQADGIAVRSVEMFNAFGFAERAMREAYWVNETVFWSPDPDTPDDIIRTKRIDDVEEGLSEFPHLILNQARVHDFYLDVMRNGPGRIRPDYNHLMTGLTVNPDASHPVTVTLDHAGNTETIRARYVVGCEGARSTVREAIGLTLNGDSANKAWGVMDVLAVTDFPDIRLKSVIQSSDEGSVLIIPREGGYMVRLYIEMDKLAEGERVSSRNITPDHLIAAAGRIMAPYRLDVKEVAWWSVYEIGQRLCDRFDNGGDHPCVFIAGDACHTHSPKAGQGMNVSMGDAFNLGWKLAAVLRGRARPEVLLTYSQERRGVAQTLIDFDRDFAAMFSAQAKGGGDPAEFQRYFVQHGRFTAGTAIQYAPSLITGRGKQDLASGFEIGTRFHSAPVIRLADAKPMHLGHAVKADGRWRLFLFAAEGEAIPADSLHPLCEWLANDPDGPMRFCPKGADIDAMLDVRAVLRQAHRHVALAGMPDLLLPAKGRYGLTDYEKIFCPAPASNIFAMRGISTDGCMVLVRPDQHVADVLALGDQTTLDRFLNGFMIAPPKETADDG